MSIVSWGAGASGALGNGQGKDELVPAVVEGSLRGKHFVQVAAGEQHSLALDDFGNVYAWGRNAEGQCGGGHRSKVCPTPARIDKLAHERIVKIAAGCNQSFAINSEGSLFRWGLFHERIQEEEEDASRFFEIGSLHELSDWQRRMIDRSTYMYYANVRDGNDDDGDEGEGGDETAPEEDDDYSHRTLESIGRFRRHFITTPERLELPEADDFVRDIAAGYSFYLIVTESGRVYSFGFNDKGQLGIGSRFTQERPHLVPGLDGVRIVRAAAGQQHSVAISDRGDVYTWGSGVFGLGHGDTRDQFSPRRVEALAGVRIVQVACGTNHTLCLSENGEIWVIGHGEYGQLGRGDFGEHGDQEKNALVPKQLQIHSASSAVKDIQCGHLHSLITLEDGSLWTCGWGANGVLGHGDAKYRIIPAQVMALEGERIQCTAGGWRHNLAIVAGSSTFAFDFENLVNSATRSDITFVVDKHEIAAHQCIVLPRCPRIRSMILMRNRFCWQGNERVVFHIDNTRYIVFLALLQYLYTDHLRIASYFAPEVAKLATRFRLERLEKMALRLAQRNQPAEHAVQIPDSTFHSDMAELVGAKELSDVHFSLTGRTGSGDDNHSENGNSSSSSGSSISSQPAVVAIHGHRTLLIARSPYFKALLESQHFAERNSENIDFAASPFSVDVFRAILYYLYTGDRGVVSADNGLELLAASDYWEISDLKQLCEFVVQTALESSSDSESDVAVLRDTLESADMFSAPRLKNYLQRRLARLGHTTGAASDPESAGASGSSSGSSSSAAVTADEGDGDRVGNGETVLR